MELNQYQHQAGLTAIYHEKKLGTIIYPALKLTGEAGEVSEKIGKLIRDYDWDGTRDSLPEDKREDLAKELGDVLWYIANLATDLGYNLGQIAVMNLDKLGSRKERGVIGGSGDNR